MASLEMKVGYFEEKLTQVQSEKAALLNHQFSIVKMKDDDSVILFYMGFPNYEALVNFYCIITLHPNFRKCSIGRETNK